MVIVESAALALAAGIVLGLLGRRVLRYRVRLTFAEATLCGIAGAAIGGGLTQVVLRRPEGPVPIATAIGAIIATLLVLLAVEAVAARRRVDRRSIRELVAAGESETVEFKSTARTNVHTGGRDPKIEAVIGKTVAAFANGQGGSLLIGVNDAGEATGIEVDYPHLKSPDVDRFELWLRDYLGHAVGSVTASRLTVDFDELSGGSESDFETRIVCLVRVPASPTPVLVSEAKGQARKFYLRSGNSTRELDVGDAIAYAATRFSARGVRKLAHRQ